MKKANAKFLLMFLLSIAVLAYFVFSFTVYVVRPTFAQNVSGNITLNATTEVNATNVTFMFYYAGNLTSAYNLTINASDNSGNGNTTFGAWFNTSLLADGLYNITVNATNETSGKFGVANGTNNSIWIRIDNTPPAVTINTPLNNANYTKFDNSTIVLNATVTDSVPIFSVIFMISNRTVPFNLTATNLAGNFWSNVTLTVNSSILDVGNHTITIFANNTLGNMNSSETVNIMVDSTPPVVQLINSSFNTTSGRVNITFNVTDNVFAYVNCNLYFNGTSYGNNRSSWNSSATYINTTINTSIIANGIWNVNVSCIDGAGLTGNSSSIIVVIDNSTPRVSAINAPVNNSYYNASTATIILNVTVTDFSPVHIVLFNVSNLTAYPFNITATNEGGYFWNVTLNLSRLAESAHNITVLANDTFGYLNNSQRFVITYDTTKPNVSNATVASITSSGATLTVIASDSLAGIGNCTYIGAGTGNLTLSTGTTYSGTLSGLVSSTAYTAYVTCKDKSGNANTSSVTFTTLSASSTSSSSSSSGSGSQGSTGGVSAGITGDYEQTTWASINSGESASIDIENGAIGVTEVDFGVSQTVYGAWVKVEKKDSLPSSVESFSGESYRFLHITTSSVFS